MHQGSRMQREQNHWCSSIQCIAKLDYVAVVFSVEANI